MDNRSGMTSATLEPTIDDLASWLQSATSDDRRLRAVGEFLDRFTEVPPNLRASLLADEPTTTGDGRWDAFLAGLTEWLSVRDGLPIPTWATLEARTAEPLLWVGALPAQRVWALAHSPAAFRRHGVFLHPDDLVRA